MDNELERLLTPRQVSELEGVSLTTIYDRLAAGAYDAIKDGNMTRIRASSVARRRASLPKAQYGARKGIRGVPPKAAEAAS
jgi:hypothetical protein